MDSSKLFKVAQDILSELTDNNLSGLLANFLEHVRQNTPDSYESAMETQKQLEDIFGESVANKYTPTYLEIVKSLGAENYVGEGGKQAIARLTNSSPLELTTSLEAYVSNFNHLIPRLQKLTESLSEVGVEPYEYDQYEIGYTIPSDLADLDEVAKRLKYYNKLVSLISTVAGDSDSSVELSRVSNGSLEFFILKSMGVARIMDVILKHVLDLYGEIQTIKKASAEIEGIKSNTLKTKTETLQNLVALEKEYSECFVEDTLDEVMEGYKGEESVREEVRIQLGVTIKLMLKDIQSGIKVEVSPPNIHTDEKAKSGEPALLKRITSNNRGLVRLYSQARETLKLPQELEVSADEKKQLDKDPTSKTKTTVKRATTRKPQPKK